MKAGTSGEKTGGCEEDAAVSWTNGDIQFAKRKGENSSARAKNENLEQDHLALSKSGTSSRRQTMDSSGSGENFSGEPYTSEMQSAAARTVYQMVPLAASTTTALALARSFGEKPEYDESFSTTSIETVTTKPKADVPFMSNGVIYTLIAGSSSVMKNRMLREAMNLAPEACKLFDPGGQGLAYDVSLA